MASGDSWTRLERDIVTCRRCPRLVAYREAIARSKRRAFRDQVYWGRPVPAFGDRSATILFVGLAPAAHGANRTGRMFTGDRSGEWLYGALYRAGLASGPASLAGDDGLELRGALVTAACRCAPPDNRPAPDELGRCAGFLDRELDLLPSARVVVALGSVAWIALMRRAARMKPGSLPRPRPRFGHGAVCQFGPGQPVLVASYHPSRQNTNTGRLTPEMFDAVWSTARQSLFNV
jgi:uracil-DNA glycosylase family 4